MPTRTHVAVVKPHLIGAILSGRKRVESRFYQTRRAPLDCIAPGDRLWLRPVGGRAVARARVGRVRQWRGLTPRDVRRIEVRYEPQILAGRRYWRERRSARFGILVWLTDVRVTARPWAAPRLYGGGWQILPAGARGRSGRG
jgi:hypothetical protein